MVDIFELLPDLNHFYQAICVNFFEVTPVTHVKNNAIELDSRLLERHFVNVKFSASSPLRILSFNTVL